MAIRRQLFLEQGGFDGSFVGNAWGFGADFGLRMAKRGLLGRYVGSAIIVHYEARIGGTRMKPPAHWFRDFMHNQSIVNRNLGPQAWLGSIPRILKYLLLKFL